MLSFSISPLDLMLDDQNPGFVVLEDRTQEKIRKYLATYEDVCQLAVAINDYGNLLPGERIVVLQENGKYVVVEGNRRTCSLQMLMSREFVPKGFEHKIPVGSSMLLENCKEIEVDVLADREAAMDLMTKRHIQGVKEWKPLAKKQFFAEHYRRGQSVRDLSTITGESESKIKDHIREYKFFFYAYNRYCELHPEFNKEIVALKLEPFWRIFKATIEFPKGNKTNPKSLLRMNTDENYNTISALPKALFEQIVQVVFEKAIVQETVNTRNVLTNIDGISEFLTEAYNYRESDNSAYNECDADSTDIDDEEDYTTENGSDDGIEETQTEGKEANSSEKSDGSDETRQPGGPPPRKFFEELNWHKLGNADREHQGLIIVANELYALSKKKIGRDTAYKVFPTATGMVLRTTYEQALRLRLKKANLWDVYMNELREERKAKNNIFPTLKSMEEFIRKGERLDAVFPDQELKRAFNRVIAFSHREFLNENIHYAENIRVTSESLEAIAAGGMFRLIQGIIDLVN